MTRKGAAGLGWSLFAIAVALAVSGLVMAAERGEISTSAAGLAPALALGGVGAAIASRRPGNPLGWLFCVTAIAAAVDGFSFEYGTRALRTDPGSLPAAGFVTWVTTWFWIPTLGATGVFLFLLFPEGRLPSPRWRPVAWFGGAAIAAATLCFAFGAGSVQSFPEQPNPMALGDVGDVLRDLKLVVVLLVCVAILVAAASLPLRMRSARGAERQQLKWFASAAVLLAVTLLAAGPLWDAWAPARLLIFASMTALALAVGVAVLRYRLYDIDVVINRTLVYGALTATLAAAYLGLVLLLQLALGPLTEDNDLAIAGSTLAMAALVRPLRGRIQAIVDRRFYRRRYDAARTLEGFGSMLRDEVDLDALGADLRGVVAETMQPAHVSLWLREDAG